MLLAEARAADDGHKHVGCLALIRHTDDAALGAVMR